MSLTQRKGLFWLLASLLFFVFLYEIRAILLPFVVGMLTAYFLDPVVDRLERRGLGRRLATVVVTVTFFSIVILAFIALVPLISQQLMDLMEALPGYISHFTARYGEYLHDLLARVQRPEQLEAIQGAFGDASGLMAQFTGEVVQGVLQSGLAFLNLLSLLLIAPVVAFYLLKDWDRMTAHADALLPLEHADTVRAQLREIDRTLAGFLRGQFSVMLILGAFYAVALSVAGLRYGLVIGMLSGLLVIVPYIGALTGGALAVGVAFMQFDDMTRVWIVLGIYLLGQALEGNIISPKLVGDQVGLHPVWLIFGLLAGGALFGFVGVLLAVPVTAVIGVLVRFAVSRYLQSSLYQGASGR